jgi:hypothetical protein
VLLAVAVPPASPAVSSIESPGVKPLPATAIGEPFAGWGLITHFGATAIAGVPAAPAIPACTATIVAPTTTAANALRINRVSITPSDRLRVALELKLGLVLTEEASHD